MKYTGLIAALIAGLLPGLAQAGTRDDVVQGIVRCGAIADDRQWLDCIYGAAQPMRAQLGLSPAPAAQQKLVPAQGYGTLPGYGGTPMPVPRATASAPPPTEYVRPTSRGMFDGLLGEANVPTIVSRIASYEFDRNGIFTVTLVNGQIWRQLPDETHLAHWNKPATTYTVSISPGAFGSFNLIVKDQSSVYKVNRVK